MLLKISMPGQFQFRMIQDWKSVFFHRGGDIHYIGCLLYTSDAADE